jgi:hypothetical protein
MTSARAKKARLQPVWVLGLLGLAACATAGAERIIGPDGAPMLFVHCGSNQSECFRLAGERCPHGYDFAPVHDPNTGNFFVRCRRATFGVSGPAPVAAPAPVQTFYAPAPATSPSGDWPPGVVGRATEPWQNPAANSAAPQNPPPPAPRTHLGEVDIGY